MTREKLFRDMYAALSSSLWDCVFLLDKAKFAELRETLMAAIEESETLLMNYDFTSLDIEEIAREDNRRH